MKRVLISGAAGFVGANLAHRAVREGHAVHLLLRHDSDTWRLDALRAEMAWHTVDLQDEAAVTGAVARIKPEWVFHLAAYGAYSRQRDPRRMVHTNILGTINLAQAALAAGCELFINTGSSSEYGFKQHAPAEDEWLEPNSHYAVTKAAATHFCRYTAREWAGRMVTLRLYSVYGPYEEPARLIPTLLVHGLRGTLPPLVNPTVARDFVYIDDVLDAYCTVATAPSMETGAVFNVGSGRQTTIAEVVDAVRELCAISAVPAWGSMPDRQWDTGVWVADNRKIRETLGWRPVIDMEEGLRRTLRWLEGHPQHMEFYSARQGV